ncbi:efflux RND transporter periplasmic adaptor subunit [Pelagicoccus mobilis]|uniref:Efflux RND transporter periplasmic adaptor subunit n=1 Tax=Pelagicoccus mobilis TaxID=415221 RepID=A0A934S1E4_9BACT|nr:efflux RND transporter periplasmic adaptor subunit [Pelagicoccus mobilis]MBK1878097.1 efflux RND transporter periplasmic adaptor subunit [Pelagicoccus mobilis]
MDQDLNRPSVAKWLFLHVVPAILMLVIASGAVFGLAIALKKPPETLPAEKILPAVDVLVVQPTTHTISVESQGTVEPRTQTTLFAEVSGRIESISPALYAGGFFKKGDILATIDDTDYIANLASARSRYADANLAYQQELATSAQAQEDWKALSNGETPTDLVLRKPQLARAKSNLEAAQAAVASAERDFSRTVVKAPYNGRVQRKFVDVGQYANARQSQIASIYSVDTAEIRLGLSLQDTQLVRVPETYSDGSESGTRPGVTIKSIYGGEEYSWRGTIDRSEGAVDPMSRLLYIVAQVDDPYGKDPSGERPPLKVGSFVTAEIDGAKLQDAYVIPRRALRENDTLFIIRDDSTLEIRPVTPIQKTTEITVIQGQLSPGEKVCLTPLQYVVNGMEVILPDEESAN